MDCSFCGVEIRKGLDSIYVTSKGRMYHFCSSKCEKNLLKLGRSNRRVRWTNAYRREKEARLKLLKEGLTQEEIKKLEKKEEEKGKTEQQARPDDNPPAPQSTGKKTQKQAKKKGQE